MNPEDAVTMFKWFQKETGASDVAAALLVLATRSLKVQADDSVGHEVCMGIRHGLFGGHAPPNATLNNVAEIIASSRG